MPFHVRYRKRTGQGAGFSVRDAWAEDDVFGNVTDPTFDGITVPPIVDDPRTGLPIVDVDASWVPAVYHVDPRRGGEVRLPTATEEAQYAAGKRLDEATEARSRAKRTLTDNALVRANVAAIAELTGKTVSVARRAFEDAFEREIK